MANPTVEALERIEQRLVALHTELHNLRIAVVWKGQVPNKQLCEAIQPTERDIPYPTEES